MAKYADSFEDTLIHTEAGTTYSDWFDIDFANEIYAYTTHDFLETVTGDESVTIMLQRNTPDNAATVFIFTTRNACAIEEERHGSWMYDGNIPSAENKLGTKVRFKMVSTGNAWTTNQAISVVCTIYAKRN